MKISIITLFPNIFSEVLNTSILGRAQKKGLVNYELIDLRIFGDGPHQIVDDRPYGGGVGMIFKADILAKALDAISSKETSKPYVILTSASGKKFDQKKAKEIA